MLFVPSDAESGKPLATVIGTSQDSLFGWNVSDAGDVNGDGHDDIIVGAPGYDKERGRVYIFFGGPWFSGELKAESANITINGSTQGDMFGWDVSGAGDMNKDGLDDVIIGAPGYDNDTGKAYVFFGQKFSLAAFKSKQANITILGEVQGSEFGSSVSDAGDVNKDGYDDIIIGAPYYDGWWNKNWANRIKLTFDNSGQSEDLSNFPVLINLSSTKIDYLKAKPDGTDLRFIDDDGKTELKCHIEQWDPSGFSLVWVNVTKIDAGSATDHIWMYYGNPVATDVQDPEGTYDSDYVGVWHLNETVIDEAMSGVHYDSTSYNNHGSQNKNDDISGKIANGQVFDGTDDKIHIIDDPSLQIVDMTLEAWVFIPGVMPVGWGTIVEHDRSDVNWYGLWKSGNGNVFHFRWSTGSVRRTDFNSPIVPNSWYYVAGVLNASTSTAYGYLNGDIDVTVPGADPPIPSSGITRFGSSGDGTEDFLGIIDEVRISRKARSSDWLKAQYLSMNNSFIKFDGEETNSQKPGAVYIFHGKGSVDAIINATDADAIIRGDNPGELFGFSVSGAGDVNKDGKCDMIVGAPGYNGYQGRAYIFYGGNLQGYNDIVTANYNTGTITLLNGTSSNKWESEYTLDAGAGASSVYVGDANNDGYNDIVTADRTANTITIYNGTSTGWEAKTTLSVGNGPRSVFVGDANNDGFNDILTANYGTLYNGSSSGWEAASTFDVGNGPYSVFVGDANNDGYNDIVTGNYDAGSVTLYNGTPSNIWESQSTFNAGAGAESVFIADANNDGYYDIVTADEIDDTIDANNDGFNDIVTADNSDNTITLYNGTSDKGWKTKSTFKTGNSPKSVFIDDANNDGYNDMLSGNSGSDTVTIYNGTSGKTWESMGTLDVGDYPRGIFVADANNDMSIFSSDADVILTGEASGDNFGWSVSDLRDIDNNGFDDIIIGSPQNISAKGMAYIFEGKHITDKGAGDRYINLSGGDTANVTLTSEDSGDLFGYCVSGAGDFNGDGYNDTIVGAPNATATGNGAIYVFHGNPSMSSSIPATNANFTSVGEIVSDRFGWSVSGAGNVNPLEGSDEILVGAPYYNEGAITDSGKTYIYYYLSPSYKLDLLINGSLDNVYQDTPSGAQVNITNINVNSNATWWLVVQNDGDSDDIIVFGITTNMLAGWTWELRDNVTLNKIIDGEGISLAPGEWRNYTLNISSPLTAAGGEESWVIVNVTSKNNVSVKDSVKAIAKIENTPPIIKNVTAFPEPQERWGNVNITCNATDNVNVYGAWVNITYPNGTWSVNVSMTHAFADQWYYNTAWPDVGNYTFSIWTNDTNDNWNGSSGWFRIRSTMHAYFVPGDIIIDGIMDEPAWSDPTTTVTTTTDFYGHNITVYVLHKVGILYIGVEMGGNENNNGNDYFTLSFDTLNDGSSTPQIDDKMIFVKDTGSGNDVFYYEGDGAIWQPTALPIGWKGDSKMWGAVANCEFAIPVLDLWGAVPPPDNTSVQFTVDAYEDANPKTRVWWPDNGFDGEFPATDYSDLPYSFGTLVYHGTSLEEELVLKELYLQDDGDNSPTDVFDLTNRSVPSDTPLQDYDSDGKPGLWIDNKWDPSKPEDTQRYQYWNLTPELAADFHMVGYINLVLWVNVSDTNKDIVVSVEIYDNVTKAGGANEPFAQTSFKRPVWATTWEEIQIPIPITGGEHTVKSGNKILLLIYMIEDKAKELYLAYGNSTYPSRLEYFTNDTFVNVPWVKTYNTSAETSTFIQGEDIFIMANVTDPFGSYDISGANMTVHYPDGSVLMGDIAMTLNLTDPSALSLWKLFNYTIAGTLVTQAGIYTVNVTGIEENGVTFNATAYFQVLHYQPDLWLNGSVADVYQDTPSMCTRIPHLATR
jgi:hypothetical protein